MVSCKDQYVFISITCRVRQQLGGNAEGSGATITAAPLGREANIDTEVGSMKYRRRDSFDGLYIPNPGMTHGGTAELVESRPEIQTCLLAPPEKTCLPSAEKSVHRTGASWLICALGTAVTDWVPYPLRCSSQTRTCFIHRQPPSLITPQASSWEANYSSDFFTRAWPTSVHLRLWDKFKISLADFCPPSSLC